MKCKDSCPLNLWIFERRFEVTGSIVSSLPDWLLCTDLINAFCFDTVFILWQTFCHFLNSLKNLNYWWIIDHRLWLKHIVSIVKLSVLEWLTCVCVCVCVITVMTLQNRFKPGTLIWPLVFFPVPVCMKNFWLRLLNFVELVPSILIGLLSKKASLYSWIN